MGKLTSSGRISKPVGFLEQMSRGLGDEVWSYVSDEPGGNKMPRGRIHREAAKLEPSCQQALLVPLHHPPCSRGPLWGL